MYISINTHNSIIFLIAYENSKETKTNIQHYLTEDGTVYASISRETTPAHLPFTSLPQVTVDDDMEPYAELRVDAVLVRERTHTGSSSLASAFSYTTDITTIDTDFHAGSPGVQPYAASMFNIVNEDRPIPHRRATVSGNRPEPYSLPSPLSPLNSPSQPKHHRVSLQHQTGAFIGSAPQFAAVQRKKSHASSAALLPTVGEERADEADPMNENTRPIFTIPAQFSTDADPGHTDTDRSPQPYIESPVNMRKLSMQAAPFIKRTSASLPRNLPGMSSSEPYLDFSPTIKKKFQKQVLGPSNESDSGTPVAAYEVPTPVTGRMHK